MEDLTGRQFGPYQIVAPLGEGGMAAVYKAYQPNMERYVAVKVLSRQLAEDAQFAARFQREAKILAQLQHPHILPVFDFGQADGYSYIVMPFIPSGTLAATMSGQPLSLPRIRQVISQIGDALYYAHKRNLVHRDVKPSNVLIDESGNCLLTDFGLARMVESAVNITSTGTIMGTPSYMSPEQGAGKTIDARSDVYSLGVILYEMATGRVPFKAETPIAVVLKHMQDPLPPPRTVNPQLPEAVERVILKALSKQPEGRYQTAGDMAQAIQSAIPEGVASVAAKAPPARAANQTVVMAEHGAPPASPKAPKAGFPYWVLGAIGAVALVTVIAAILLSGRGTPPPAELPATVGPIEVTAAPTAEPTPTRVRPTPAPATLTNLTAPNQLRSGQELVSYNKQYSFKFQADGNLVVLNNDSGVKRWESNTLNHQADHLVLQDTGELALFDQGNQRIWSTKTIFDQGDYFLSMQDDGNLVIYHGKPSGEHPDPIWASDSAQ